MKTSQIDNEGNIVLVWDEDTGEIKLKNKLTGQILDKDKEYFSLKQFDNAVTRYRNNYLKR